jgi:hypothetical protein
MSTMNTNHKPVLHVTHHAVERFIKYWRRGMPLHEARQCLKILVGRSTATRRRTLPGDAWVHVALTDRGEQIGLAVRDGTVVTVLPRHAYEVRDLCALADDHRATIDSVEFERARLAERVETNCAREKAESIVAAWRAGAHVRPKALRRARQVLGLGLTDA